MLHSLLLLLHNCKFSIYFLKILWVSGIKDKNCKGSLVYSNDCQLLRFVILWEMNCTIFAKSLQAHFSHNSQP